MERRSKAVWAHPVCFFTGSTSVLRPTQASQNLIDRLSGCQFHGRIYWLMRRSLNRTRLAGLVGTIGALPFRAQNQLQSLEFRRQLSSLPLNLIPQCLVFLFSPAKEMLRLRYCVPSHSRIFACRKKAIVQSCYSGTLTTRHGETFSIASTSA